MNVAGYRVTVRWRKVLRDLAKIGVAGAAVLAAGYLDAAVVTAPAIDVYGDFIAAGYPELLALVASGIFLTIVGLCIGSLLWIVLNLLWIMQPWVTVQTDDGGDEA